MDHKHAAFLAAPGVVVGLMPWVITRRQGQDTPSWPLPPRLLGSAMIVAGVMALVSEFVRFVREGHGTPAPVVPTSELVVGGPYHHVRNPMYVAVVAAIVGQAIWFGSWSLAAFALGMAGVMATFVRLYEEPALYRRHGVEYDGYRRAVPRWIPGVRRTPAP